MSFLLIRHGVQVQSCLDFAEPSEQGVCGRGHKRDGQGSAVRAETAPCLLLKTPEWKSAHRGPEQWQGFPSTPGSPLPLFAGVKFREPQRKQRDLWYSCGVLWAASGTQPGHLGRAVPGESWPRAGAQHLPGHPGCATAGWPGTQTEPCPKGSSSAIGTGHRQGWTAGSGGSTSAACSGEIRDERGPVESSSPGLPQGCSQQHILQPEWSDLKL